MATEGQIVRAAQLWAVARTGPVTDDLPAQRYYKHRLFHYERWAREVLRRQGVSDSRAWGAYLRPNIMAAYTEAVLVDTKLDEVSERLLAERTVWSAEAEADPAQKDGGRWEAEKAVIDNLPLISAAVILDRAPKLNDLLKKAEHGSTLDIDEVMRIVFLVTEIERAFLTLNMPRVKASAFGQKQGDRRRSLGERNRQLVRTAAENLLRGPDAERYVWDTPGRRGAAKVQDLRRAVARDTGLPLGTVKHHLDADLISGLQPVTGRN